MNVLRAALEKSKVQHSSLSQVERPWVKLYTLNKLVAEAPMRNPSKIFP